MGLCVDIRKQVAGFALDVTWDIGAELAVLFGYSGSGKSMTLQCLAGLSTPDSGRIDCDGEVLFDSARRVNRAPQRRPFGYVTQGCTLFPHMTVQRNIAYALKGVPARDRVSRIAEVVDALQLHGLEHRLPGQLAGGQKQRAQLARALVREPRALLLDEPFSALDTPVRVEMRQVVREVCERFRLPVVLVTHDLYEAYTMADRMIVYSGSGDVQVGSPCELFKSPATPEIETLLTSERLFMLE